MRYVKRLLTKGAVFGRICILCSFRHAVNFANFDSIASIICKSDENGLRRFAIVCPIAALDVVVQ